MKSGLAFWLILWGMLICIPVHSYGASAEAGKVNDIYLVFYLSQNGRTGHLGLAVDNYYIVVRDIVHEGVEVSVYDTVRNYTLTYFDLWGPPEIGLDQHGQNLACRYYKLPRTSAEPKITERYFRTKGLPHAYDYPCDGLLRIRTTPGQDMQMVTIAEVIRQRYPYFNTRSYNCVDYIIYCLNTLFDVKIVAKEFIPFTWSSTPNKLYTTIGSYLDVEVVKDAGVNAQNSFVSERIFNSLFYNQNRHHEEHN
jgi:hypothetical protein